MAPREILHGLDDMLAAIDGIMAATAGKTFADYAGSWLLKRAVERGIEIISEASRVLSPGVQALRPEIPWAQVRSIGNVLRHEYHSLSDPVIWGVVVDELPQLREAVVAIKAHWERGPTPQA